MIYMLLTAAQLCTCIAVHTRKGNVYSIKLIVTSTGKYRRLMNVLNLNNVFQRLPNSHEYSFKGVDLCKGT